MTTQQLGALTRMKAREVWPNEARDFTPWLASHIGQLGDVLDMQLDVEGQEAPVGSFSLDVLARDLNTDRHVIIENQLERTDHDHLGKLLTYAAGYNADAVIWISTEIREEHRQALDWLNQRTDTETEFYGIVVEVLRIGDSLPAVNFKLVAFPNEWRKTRSVAKSEPSERAERYREYFQKLIDELRDVHHFTGARKAQPQGWCSFSSGISGISYGTSFAQKDRARTEIYIDFGEGARNKHFFDLVQAEADQLEKEFGEKISWERLDDRRACKIAVYRPGSIEAEADELQQIQEWAVQRLLRFKRVFGPRLGEWLSDLPDVQDETP